MSNELEKFVNNNRDAFDDRMPNPAVLQRLQEQMSGMNKKKGIVISFRTVRWAAACVVVLAGAGIFYLTQKNDAVTKTMGNGEIAKQSPAVAPSTHQAPAKESVPVITNPETNYTVQQASQKGNTTEMQLALRRQALFAQLNDMESPGARVTAAAEAYKLKGADKEIVDALVGTMNNDPNTNVRLAALDGLTRFKRETYVKEQLVKSLKKQTDPMVQIQLIQVLTRMKETSILDQLEKMVKDDNTMEAVKDNAYSSILTLKS